MERCPICRAQLNGGDSCRRCRATLGAAQRTLARADHLERIALLAVALGSPATAVQLLARARLIHETPLRRSLHHRLAARAVDPDGL